MRLAAYAGTSTVLATAVVLRAFHERANFYSACVYLAQSNACLMILTNLVLLLVSLMLLGLQRLLYGPLRPIEIEQLYEKAWFAITETCLAMTIFREEVGGWFLVMFVGLLVGKVWAWIGEGRVEIVEQQPPANPRLFHARLSFSLLLSLAFDLALLRYAIMTVLRMARPTMMVMFAFEFAVLTISSSSTAARYAISLFELYTIQKQTQLKLEERRAHLRAERAASRTEQNAGQGPPSPVVELDEVDEADVDVPGWELKGRWVFYLDLLTDFLKLIVYLSFFSILLTFYGLPIHIMRDVFLTLRSFTKRIVDFLRFRRATKDMNERYPDAVAEEISREDVCIICREEMRPWRPELRETGPGNAGPRPNAPANAAVDERSRPKKLPCGHILHLGCLRSWLERQQICPTCRRPVMVTNRITVAPTNQVVANQPGGQVLGQAGQPQQQPQAGAAMLAQPGAPQEVRQPPRGRIFNIGPLRIGFGRGNVFQDLVQQMQNGQAGPLQPGGQDARAENANRPQLSFGLGFGRPARTADHAPSEHSTRAQSEMQGSVQAQLQQLEERINLEISSLRVNADQLRLVQMLQAELARLRQIHHEMHAYPSGARSFGGLPSNGLPPTAVPTQAVNTIRSSSTPASQPGLPPALSLPPGWTLLPLQRVSALPEGSHPSSASHHIQGSSAGSNREGRHSSGHGRSASEATDNGNNTPVASGSRLPQDTAHAPTEISQHVPSTAASESAVASKASSALASGSSTKLGQATSDLAGASQTPGEPLLPSVPMPAWASSESVSSMDHMNMDGSDKEGVSSPQQPASSPSGTTSTAAKGKGKAVTVEDYIDDVD